MILTPDTMLRVHSLQASTMKTSGQVTFLHSTIFKLYIRGASVWKIRLFCSYRAGKKDTTFTESMWTLPAKIKSLVLTWVKVLPCNCLLIKTSTRASTRGSYRAPLGGIWPTLPYHRQFESGENTHTQPHQR